MNGSENARGAPPRDHTTKVLISAHIGHERTLEVTRSLTRGLPVDG